MGESKCSLMLSDPLVAESLFDFVMVVYKSQVYKNLGSDINTEVNMRLAGMSRFTDKS
jgi:hypothetical protein